MQKSLYAYGSMAVGVSMATAGSAWGGGGRGGGSRGGALGSGGSGVSCTEVGMVRSITSAG